jgi:hypothetical protein
MMGVIVLATISFPSAGRAWESSVAVHTNGWFGGLHLVLVSSDPSDLPRTVANGQSA